MSKDNEKPVDNSAATEAAFKEGYATAKAELAAMLSAFPTDPTFAVQQFSANKSLTEAKLAKAERAEAELAAVTAKLAEAEKKLALAGAGQAAVGSPPPASSTEKPTDPKALAAWEWANEKPVGFSSEKNYVAYRVAELSGRASFKK